MKKRTTRERTWLRPIVLLVLLTAVSLFSGCRKEASYEDSSDIKKISQQESVSEAVEAGAVSGDAFTDDLTVRFLDVGQGNAVLAECGGHYMLIDGGDSTKSSYVVSYLKNLGISELDYVVVSHYDDDHLNGLVGVLNKFQCRLVLSPDYQADTKIYQSYLSVMKRKGFLEIHPSVGQTYELGNAEFTIVCPKNYQYEEENDNSIGIRLRYGSNSFLICGDASAESEADMTASGLTLKSDVYMASHHGSSSSGTDQFLKAVDPSAVVISAGFGNPYGHPAKSAMKRIKKTKASLYRTDLQGELIAVSNGKEITWNTKPSQNYSCGDDVASMDEAKQERESKSRQEKYTYIINTGTEKFHLSGCGSVSQIPAESLRVSHDSRKELMEQGYSPCKVCIDK